MKINDGKIGEKLGLDEIFDGIRKLKDRRKEKEKLSQGCKN